MPYFKTSYVEVYRIGCAFSPGIILFQNILCWSLSMRKDDTELILSEFQNILCWSLSMERRIKEIRVLVFQNILCWSLSIAAIHDGEKVAEFQNILCWSLSSSSQSGQRESNPISKHLMLKFIRCDGCNDTGFIDISKHLMLKFIIMTAKEHMHYKDFKTSYVEVYQYLVRFPTAALQFQNILCWSLSNRR